MNIFDKEILGEFNLDKNAVLKRVVNGGGIPYSIIEIDGREIYSCPTKEEQEMIDFYKRGKQFEKLGDNAKSVSALFSELLDICIEKADSFNGDPLDVNKTIREVSYIVYAYAGGKGKFDEE